MKKLFAVLSFMGCCFMAASAHAESADAMIRQSSKEVLDVLKKDNGRNTRQVKAELETVATPKFDFQRMTALAVGRGWRQATPQQQEQLVGEFRTLLVRTYAATMVRFKNARIEVDSQPLMANNGNEATVKTAVQTGDASSANKPVQIDYVLYKSGGNWKIFNVSVEGASLVTVYRGNFTDIINQQGVDGLIQNLRDKNTQLASKNGA